LLTLGLCFGSLLRLWDLSTTPPSVWYDEIFAWTLALDQLRSSGPFLFPSTIGVTISRLLFGFYPAIILLGPTTLAGRIFGSLYGIALIVGTYLLGTAFFSRKIGEWSSLVVAIAPIAIQSSRVFYGAESSDGLVFLVFGTLLVYSGVRRVSPSWPMLIAGFALLGFASGYYFTDYGRPTALLVSVALFVYGLRLNGRIWPRSVRASFALYGATTFLLIALLIPDIGTTSALIATSKSSFYLSNQNILISGGSNGFLTFGQRFVSYFSPQFLFFVGDPNPGQNTTVTGEFSLALLPFFYSGLVLAIWLALRSSRYRFEILLMLMWLLTVPLESSAFAPNDYTDSFSVIFLIPAVAILSAIAIVATIGFIDRHRSEPDVTQPPTGTTRIRGRGIGGRHWVSRVASIGLVAVLLASAYPFALAYFVENPDSTVNDPTSVWGIIYGFPEVVNYIMGHDLESWKILLSPSGLFGNNSATFDYYYYVAQVPQLYFDYYSDGRIPWITVTNTEQFSTNSPALIVTGSIEDLRSLRAESLIANTVYTIDRPDGNLSLALIEVLPGVNSTAAAQLNTTKILALQDLAAPTSVNITGLSNYSATFSVSALFNFSAAATSPGGQHTLAQSSSPTFNLGFWSETFFNQSAPPDSQVIQASVYSKIDNFSKAGSWWRIEGGPVLYPQVDYFVTLIFSNDSLALWLNTTEIGTGFISYSVWPLTNPLYLNQGGNTTVSSISMWNTALTSGEIGYVYYSSLPTLDHSGH
jgi:hypothetical protein